ncbi:MAG: S-layer homology domain-containing protein, partial [Syntrophomonas sp.]
MQKSSKVKITLILISVALSLLIIPHPALAQFSDLKNHWADPAVSRTSALELIKGYPDNTFKAEKELSQMEALVLFMRGAGYNFDKVSKKKANDKNPNTGTVKTPQVPWGQNYLDA